MQEGRILRDLELQLEGDEVEHYLHGIQLTEPTRISYWYFELFKVYQNETKLHKHVISRKSIATTDENINFFSPYKCPYGSMSYERIYSEVNKF